MDTVKIFVSYSHQNSDWVDENGKYNLIPWLKKQLEQYNVVFWTDHVLKNHIGEAYKKKIKENIDNSDITLLMISQEFATSEFITNFELPWIKEAFEADKIRIIPLLITKLAKLGKKNVEWLFELQTIPNDTKPLIEYCDNDINWSNIRIDILDAIDSKIETVRNEPQEKKEREKKQQEERDRIAHEQKLQQEELLQKLNVEMVFVEGGTFMMGCERGGDCWQAETPLHSVTLSSFSIGKYPITQKLWKAIMENNPSKFEGDSLPVENVSWGEVQDFISKLNARTGKNYQLPTEAQWEYVARGGSKSKRYKYSGSNNVDNVAWYNDNSGGKTHPVGTKQSNELGIYDMNGNVWEWCHDWYDNYAGNKQTNPTGPAIGSERVLRGGSWGSSAWHCRVSFRNHRTGRCDNSGFRLALSV